MPAAYGTAPTDGPVEVHSSGGLFCFRGDRFGIAASSLGTNVPQARWVAAPQTISEPDYTVCVSRCRIVAKRRASLARTEVAEIVRNSEAGLHGPEPLA